MEKNRSRDRPLHIPITIYFHLFIYIVQTIVLHTLTHLFSLFPSEQEEEGDDDQDLWTEIGVQATLI